MLMPFYIQCERYVLLQTWLTAHDVTASRDSWCDVCDWLCTRWWYWSTSLTAQLINTTSHSCSSIFIFIIISSSSRSSSSSSWDWGCHYQLQWSADQWQQVGVDWLNHIEFKPLTYSTLSPVKFKFHGTDTDSDADTDILADFCARILARKLACPATSPFSLPRAGHARRSSPTCPPTRPTRTLFLARIESISPWHVTSQPASSTQLCIPLSLLDWVPALTGWGKCHLYGMAGNTVCWLVSSRSSQQGMLQTAVLCLLYFTLHQLLLTHNVHTLVFCVYRWIKENRHNFNNWWCFKCL